MNKTGIYLLIRKVIYRLLYNLDQITGRKAGVIVLCYHSISRNKWRYSVSPDQFEKQLEYLVTNFKPITLKDLAKYLNNEISMKEPSFVITFDDGYQDILKTTKFLKNKGIIPSLFVLGSLSEVKREELDNDLPLLNEKEIGKLVNIGWIVGSHGLTHSNFLGKDNEHLKREIRDSKRRLEKTLGIKVEFFAYPKGRYSANVLKMVQDAGYCLGVTTDSGLLSKKTNAYKIPRFGVDNTYDVSEFQALCSPSVIELKNLIFKTPLRHFII